MAGILQEVIAQEVNSDVEKDQQQVAALLPSGIVRKFSLAVLLEGSKKGSEAGYSDLAPVESEAEIRRAEIIAHHLKVAPGLAGVIERKAAFPHASRFDPVRPSGERIVVVPVIDTP